MRKDNISQRAPIQIQCSRTNHQVLSHIGIILGPGVSHLLNSANPISSARRRKQRRAEPELYPSSSSLASIGEMLKSHILLRMWVLQSQGLPYLKRPRKTENHCSLKDFLVASGKQLDIKSEAPKQTAIKSIKSKQLATKSKAPNERPDNAGGHLGSKHAKLLIRLVRSCSEGLVTKVVTSMGDGQLDILSQLMESCPLDMTTRVVGSLVEMGTKEFDFITHAVKSFTKEKLGKVVKNMSNGVDGKASLNQPEISQELEEAQNVKVVCESVSVKEDDGGGEDEREEDEKEEDGGGKGNHMELKDETFVHGLTIGKGLDEKDTNNKEAHDESEINTNEMLMDEKETSKKLLGKNGMKKKSPIGIDIKSEEVHVSKSNDHHNDHGNVKNEGKFSPQIYLGVGIYKMGKEDEKSKGARADHHNGNNVETEPERSPQKDLETMKKKTKKKMCKRTSYTCTICGRTLTRSSKNEVQRHLATHTAERDHKCDECGSEFSRAQELRRHKIIHTGHCPFRCNHCQAGFKAKLALRAHKRSSHNDQSVRFRDCKQCDSNFESAKAFGKHMKLVHGVGKPFTCDECGMGMSTPVNLKRHALVAHADTKPFNCEECGAMIGNKASLMRHQLGHAKANGTLSPEQEQVLRDKQSEKGICDLCGKTLSSALTMRRHLRIHAAGGLKCHTCEECGKAFSVKRSLLRHIEKHHPPTNVKVPVRNLW